MSDLVPRDRRLSVDEYLQREERAGVRHEYVAGFVYAMTGATVRHTRIIGNIYSWLRTAAASGPCLALFQDIKVRIADERFYYPDVVVACSDIDEDSVFLREPCLIVEVTSPSTRATDRREKLIAYGDIVTLQTYLIVDH